MSDSFINSIALVVLSVVLTAVAVAWATSYWNKQKAEAARDARVVELEKQMALISASVVPISTAFQAILIKELTHMHTPRLDALMAKIGPPSTLTLEEEEEMATLLRERATDMGDLISDSERDAAIMLPMVIKRARIEAEDPQVIITHGTLLQLVSTPAHEDK